MQIKQWKVVDTEESKQEVEDMPLGGDMRSKYDDGISKRVTLEGSWSGRIEGILRKAGRVKRRLLVEER